MTDHPTRDEFDQVVQEIVLLTIRMNAMYFPGNSGKLNLAAGEDARDRIDAARPKSEPSNEDKNKIEALRSALIAIIDRSYNGEIGVTSKVFDMRKIAVDALMELDGR